jgi:hypothetical protein
MKRMVALRLFSRACNLHRVPLLHIRKQHRSSALYSTFSSLRGRPPIKSLTMSVGNTGIQNQLYWPQ